MSIVFLAQRLENPQERVAIKILTPSDVAMADEFVSFQARFRAGRTHHSPPLAVRISYLHALLHVKEPRKGVQD
jgi:hypothetical protein